MPFPTNIYDECNQLEGRGNPSARQCLVCQSIEPSFWEEATLRCEDCWGGQLFCKTSCLEHHHTHPLHRIKVCNSIPLLFYCCLTIVGMTGVVMCWAGPKAHPSPAHLSPAQPGPPAGLQHEKAQSPGSGPGFKNIIIPVCKIIYKQCIDSLYCHYHNYIKLLRTILY